MKLGIFLFISLLSATLTADEITVKVYSTTNEKQQLGTVKFTDTQYGLLITPNLASLPTEAHGLHLHQHANCNNKGMEAGGHYDPLATSNHQGPYGNGHLGDLPALFVNANGTAATPLLAPRLKTADLNGLSLMIHAGGDNYTDNPPLGGGGARIGCGIISSRIAKPK